MLHLRGFGPKNRTSERNVVVSAASVGGTTSATSWVLPPIPKDMLDSGREGVRLSPLLSIFLATE